MPFRLFLLALSLLASAASAQEGAAPAAPPAQTPAEKAAPAAVLLDPATLLSVGVPRSKQERDDMETQAAVLQEESRLRKEQAETTLAESKTVCWKKFLVSACLDDTKVSYRKDVSIAKRQDREAQALTRNVRKYDAAESLRLREEENARKDAANAKKAEQHRAKRAEEQK